MLSALLFKHYNFKGCLYQEIAVYIMFTYLPFAVCTVVDLSGVVAILFTGIMMLIITQIDCISMKHYTCNNLSDEGKASYVCSIVLCVWDQPHCIAYIIVVTVSQRVMLVYIHVAKFFNAISYVSEATIFLNLGLAVFSLQEGFHFGFSVCT
ncbi:hypothetical protein AaE_003315, partial [Aphanomyces astaci]